MEFVFAVPGQRVCNAAGCTLPTAGGFEWCAYHRLSSPAVERVAEPSRCAAYGCGLRANAGGPYCERHGGNPFATGGTIASHREVAALINESLHSEQHARHILGVWPEHSGPDDASRAHLGVDWATARERGVPSNPSALRRLIPEAWGVIDETTALQTLEILRRHNVPVTAGMSISRGYEVLRAFLIGQDLIAQLADDGDRLRSTYGGVEVVTLRRPTEERGDFVERHRDLVMVAHTDSPSAEPRAAEPPFVSTPYLPPAARRAGRTIESRASQISEFGLLTMTTHFEDGLTCSSMANAGETEVQLEVRHRAYEQSHMEPPVIPVRSVPHCDTCNDTGEGMAMVEYGDGPVERMMPCPDCAGEAPDAADPPPAPTQTLTTRYTSILHGTSEVVTRRVDDESNADLHRRHVSAESTFERSISDDFVQINLVPERGYL